MLETKKILVTGGAGFIGTNLIKKLVESSNEVYSLDNYFMGSKTNHVAGANYIEGDINQIDKLINFQPDFVFHLGEYSRVEQSFNDMPLVFNTNIKGLYEVLKFCVTNKSKLIYAGSSTKFATGKIKGRSSPYSWSKAANTEFIKNYANWYNLDYAITYFYNAYGPFERTSGKYATLIGIFTKQMQCGKKLTVVKPGTQVRNFTHVDDIVAGLVTVAEKGKGDGFGIGNKKKYSVLEVAKMFGGKIHYLPERLGNREAATLKDQLTKDLGWRPQIQLEEYINQLKHKKWQIS